MKKEDLFNEKISQQIALMAISPIDGRYSDVVEEFNEYFSEYAFMKNCIYVEVSWLIFFLQSVYGIPALFKYSLSDDDKNKLYNIYNSFSIDDAMAIKNIEKTVNDDVKAVEYFITKKLKELGLEVLIPFVNFGCSSEDISNATYALMISNALNNLWIPKVEELIGWLTVSAHNFAEIAMPARTHGIHATSTTVGKEFSVYVYRFTKILEDIKSVKIFAKFNGTTGNYSSLKLSLPEQDWKEICSDFIINKLELYFNPLTTQVEGHDYMADLFDLMRHFNNILLDLCQDMWMYISYGYFKQASLSKEVDLSVNFELSESNIDMSNAIFMTLSNKLTRSRMQRDFSDYFSQRNIGLGFTYSYLSINATIKGLQDVKPRVGLMSRELNKHWEILLEPVFTMLKKYGITDADEKFSEFSIDKKITDVVIRDFIMSFSKQISQDDLRRLVLLTPATYVGLAPKLAVSILK